MGDTRLLNYVECNPTVKLKKGEFYNLVDIDSITVGVKYSDNKGLVEYTGQSGSKFSKGDTIMARITPCLENGKIAMYNGDVNSIGSTELFVFRAIPNVSNKDFVYYFMKQNSVRNYAANSMTGASGRQRADIKFIKKLKCSFPHLETQNKIADILSTYDELIENNNKRIAILEQMAENLYKEWFVRFRFPGYETAEFENGIPVGWEVKKLFDVANVKYGYAFKSDLFCDDESLNPVVRIRDIPNNKTNTYTTEQCDERYLITENSIVIGMDGIFHMCLWNGGKAYLNQRVVEIESKIENLNNLHLYYVIYPQVKYWEQTISGTTVAHLGDKHLKKMTVILPSEDISKKAKEIFDSIMLQKCKLFKQNENLIKQRDLLLPRLMSGKLEV